MSSTMVGTQCMCLELTGTVWANNGDTLSICYAHTSALKGDFVRTGKRDFAGIVGLPRRSSAPILSPAS